MKTERPLLFWCSAIALTPFLACEDTSSGGGPDASFTAPDAAFAPDSGYRPLPDAAPPDAPAGDGTATVVVTKFGAPEQGVNVVTAAPDGTLSGSGVTGADGKATLKVNDGDQLTVLVGDDASGRDLLTYVGVKRGDVLNVVDTSTRALSITLPTPDPAAGISVVAGNMRCSDYVASGANAVSITLRPDCIDGTSFPVLATTSDGATRYWTYKKGNTLAASGTTTISGLSAWTTGGSVTLDLTNAPTANGVRLRVALVAEKQRWSRSSQIVNVTGGTGSAPFEVPDGYADAYQLEAYYLGSIPGHATARAFGKRVPATGATHTLDLSGGLLPAITSVTKSATNPVRFSVSWTADGSLAATDGGVVQIPFTLTTDAGTSLGARWTFIVPPGATSVTAPQLPAQLASWQPQSTDTLYDPELAFYESSLIPSYDAVRAGAASLGLSGSPRDGTSQPTLPALGADGTVRVTAAYFND